MIHMFLLRLFFQNHAITSRGEVIAQGCSLRFNEPSSWEKMMQLSQSDVNGEKGDSMMEFSLLLRQFPTILKSLFSFDWTLNESNLQGRLGSIEDSEFPLKRGQLDQVLTLLSQQQKSPLPFEVFQSGNDYYLRTTIAFALAFLNQGVSFSLGEADQWRKIVTGFVKPETVVAVGSPSMKTKRQRELRQPPVVSPPSSPLNGHYHAPTKVDKGPKNKSKKGKKNRASAVAAQSNPPEPTSQGKQIRGKKDKLLTSSSELSVPNVVPISEIDLLLNPEHQAKTAIVQECFERLHKLPVKISSYT